MPNSKQPCTTSYRLSTRGDDRIRATYGTNYQRPAATKATYDPTNFFRVNQHIPPVR
ncbi:BBE domain-containing protein [Fibrella rubiginis]|uniref:BBE domain-containing protein n=1 Tax=Fibrella rubiginis TaxID=2817060 RepID=UPI001E638DB3|nr:BBE domain-containing protein [Fibrella rubiginis]